MPRTQGCGTHLRRRDAQQLHEVHKLLASNHSIPVLVGDGEDLLELEDAILRQVQAVLLLEVELLLEHRVLHQRLGGPSLGHLHLRLAGPRGGGRRRLSTGLSCSCCVEGGWGSGLRLVTWIWRESSPNKNVDRGNIMQNLDRHLTLPLTTVAAKLLPPDAEISRSFETDFTVRRTAVCATSRTGPPWSGRR